jgi:NitT/TauT family transport system ATP-binding protein
MSAAPTGPAPQKLQAADVRVTYVNYERRTRTSALDGVSLAVETGEFVAIVGPSGCGKTTFLNAVDGLLPIDGGAIHIDGRRVAGPGYDRAMVFQTAALMPWRTVLANITYGLEMQRRPAREARERARHYATLVGLGGFEQHFPHELSGGMQQRVNLARALVLDPQILLLDEPLASLDAQTREFMQAELLRVWRATRLTSLFVTHQIDEAVYLADRVVIFTARPARVREVLAIDLPRPRRLAIKREMRFLEYVDHVWAVVIEEARAMGMATAEAEA